MPDTDGAGNGNEIIAIVAGLKIGHHAQEGQFSIRQDMDPSVSEQAGIKAEQARLGLPGDRIGDMVTDSPAPALMQQPEAVVMSACTRISERRELDIVRGECGQRLPDLAQAPFAIVN